MELGDPSKDDMYDTCKRKSGENYIRCRVLVYPSNPQNNHNNQVLTQMRSGKYVLRLTGSQSHSLFRRESDGD